MSGIFWCLGHNIVLKLKEKTTLVSKTGGAGGGDAEGEGEGTEEEEKSKDNLSDKRELKPQLSRELNDVNAVNLDYLLLLLFLLSSELNYRFSSHRKFNLHSLM